MESTLGPMAGNMMESGSMVDNTVKASTYQKQASIGRASGKMESVPDGSTKTTPTSTDMDSNI